MDEPKDFMPHEESGDVPPEWEDALLSDDTWTEEDEEAMADLEAGRVISHEAVTRWVDAIARGDRPPRPRPGE